MKSPMDKTLPLLILTMTVSIAGCVGQQTRAKSSVVDYLYPNRSDAVVQPAVPVLKLPIKVGIAFVPEQTVSSRAVHFKSSIVTAGVLSEMKKAALMDKVAEHFRQYEFVGEIEVIPSQYLRPGGSFANLEQIKTMYGVDVIALVSYDQVQFTDEGFLSLTYWTLVGAYVVAGEKNDTSTMLDTAVYDIQSRKMLFRAPGISNIKSSATPINLSEELRRDRNKGFEAATEDMISNLDVQLTLFKEKIKRSPEQVKIVRREGSPSGGGSGAIGMVELITLLFFFSTVLLIRKMKYID